MISINDIRSKVSWDFNDNKIAVSIKAGLDYNPTMCATYHINENEWFALIMMVGGGSNIVQGYGETNDEKCLSEFCSYHFAQLLNKTPKTRFQTLYRMESVYSLTHFQNLYKSGHLFVPNGYYTSSRDLFRDDCQLIIEIEVDLENTKAHDIFEIYNHGNEYQVNFEKGAIFSITGLSGNKVFLKEY